MSFSLRYAFTCGQSGARPTVEIKDVIATIPRRRRAALTATCVGQG
jgi:hypothetical protein